jgi:prepilin-type N-terminal cleavage/methylation domain-containing protein
MTVLSPLNNPTSRFQGLGSRSRRAFTLVELMAVLVIISILASLSLAGLVLSRQRARAIRTETTIRKIHEVVMPYYERYLGRSTPPRIDNPSFWDGDFRSLPPAVKVRYETLVRARRLQAIELPDDWRDIQVDPDPAWNPADIQASETAISRRLRNQFTAATNPSNADAECLWAIVMLGGFGDPGIISHFREDEFADTNQNGLREFIDGWGKPIRFLRWAPGFVSKYQPAPPAPGAVDTRSHDVFDAAGVDPLAVNTLYPLIFSGGPDENPDIVDRINAPNPVLYPAVSFDPYFETRPGNAHLVVPAKEAVAQGYRSQNIPVAPYSISRPVPVTPRPFGSQLNPAKVNDDIHNHALSR